MTIHYHGTPISPISELETLAGRHFCVSFARRDNFRKCLEIGQSLMIDNGAFSAWRKSVVVDWVDYYIWLDTFLKPPHWAVIPDVIDGAESDNDALIDEWPFDSLGAPVWHLHESLGRLQRLIDDWERVCIGSSGEYSRVGTPKWNARMYDVFQTIQLRRETWLHGLRMMAYCGGPYPLASVDSTDIARNHHRAQNTALAMANRWDIVNANLGR